MKFIAILVDIKRLDRLPEEFLPYAEFKARYEGRELRGDELVAVFNIASTTSYLVVFLDPGKTLEEIEGEVEKQGFATLNPESRASLSKYLARD
jgi:hypothetical protein